MDAIIFPLFGHFPMDGPKRFKYTTCTNMYAFMTAKKKSLFSQISGYVWMRPKICKLWHYTLKNTVPVVSSDVPLLIRLGVGYSSGGEGLSSSIIIASSLEVS